MSFDLYVVDGDLRAIDGGELGELLDDPSHWGEPATQRLLDFVAEISRLHPPDGVGSDASPWANAPFLETVAGGAAVGLYVLWSEVDRVSAELTPLALERELCVFDPRSVQPQSREVAPSLLETSWNNVSGATWAREHDPNDRILRCTICRKEPALALPIRRQVGMVVVRQVTTVSAPLCRDHGVETAKRFLLKTLVQGWWGVISFFVNFSIVARDLSALRMYRRQGAPERLAVGHGFPSQGSWESDPFRRFDVRWLGPMGWTDEVSTNGFVARDRPGFR